MTRKTIIEGALALVFPLFSVSCDKIMDDSPEAGGICTVTVECMDPFTKAVGQTSLSEDAINNLAVLVFRTEEGAKLDACSYSAKSSSLTLECTVGRRRIYVLANAPEGVVSDVKSESDFLSKFIYLKDNGLESFMMMGCEETDISGGECNVGVKVNRMVASVRVDKITNLMDAPAYRENGLFVVRSIYLTNVVGRMALDGTDSPLTLSPDFWYARNGAENSPLFMDSKIDACVNYGADNALAVSHTFYAFPNDCPLNESPTWSQRSTMLVIEASLDGVIYYYPIEVGPLEANRQYVISEVIIRRPGTLNPWECVHKSTAGFGVEVVPWTSTLKSTEDL